MCWWRHDSSMPFWWQAHGQGAYNDMVWSKACDQGTCTRLHNEPPKAARCHTVPLTQVFLYWTGWSENPFPGPLSNTSTQETLCLLLLYHEQYKHISHLRSSVFHLPLHRDASWRIMPCACLGAEDHGVLVWDFTAYMERSTLAWIRLLESNPSQRTKSFEGAGNCCESSRRVNQLDSWPRAHVQRRIRLACLHVPLLPFRVPSERTYLYLHTREQQKNESVASSWQRATSENWDIAKTLPSQVTRRLVEQRCWATSCVAGARRLAEKSASPPH